MLVDTAHLTGTDTSNSSNGHVIALLLILHTPVNNVRFPKPKLSGYFVMGPPEPDPSAEEPCGRGFGVTINACCGSSGPSSSQFN